MPVNLHVCCAAFEDINDLLCLQSANLVQNVSQVQQGFLMWQTDLQYVQYLIQNHLILIVQDQKNLAGYIMIDTFEHICQEPFYHRFGQELQAVVYQGKPLKECAVGITAQICIDVNYRGQGLFTKLYHAAKEHTSNQFEILLAEIHKENTHSQKAHEKIGFIIVHTYTEPNGIWNVVALNL